MINICRNIKLIVHDEVVNQYYKGIVMTTEREREREEIITTTSKL